MLTPDTRASLATSLGLRTASLGESIPSYSAHFIIANFVLSYALLSTRGAKIRLGLDNNASPRYDVATTGEAAVKANKITREQLDKLKRQQACHENSVEHFPFFVGAVLFAHHAGLPAQLINKYALIYTLVRIAYAVAYARITDKTASYLRSVLWWSGNFTCFRLFWFAGKAINAKLVGV